MKKIFMAGFILISNVFCLFDDCMAVVSQDLNKRNFFVYSRLENRNVQLPAKKKLLDFNKYLLFDKLKYRVSLINEIKELSRQSVCFVSKQKQDSLYLGIIEDYSKKLQMLNANLATINILLKRCWFYMSKQEGGEILNLMLKGELSELAKQFIYNQSNMGYISINMLHNGKISNDTIIQYIYRNISCMLNWEGRNLDSPLSTALNKGYLDIADLFLWYGADINKIYKNGETLLTKALKNKDDAQIKYLLEHGADVNKTNKLISENETPLMVVISMINEKNKQWVEKTIKNLIEYGADINKADDFGVTPLCIAARQNDCEDVMKYLVQKGSNVNLKDNEGDTPLMYAIVNNNEFATKYLIEHGANINDVNKDNENVLTQLLISFGDLDERPFKNILKFLLEKGADINKKGGEGLTALALASCREKHMELLKHFVEIGGNIHTEDDAGDTPLINAIMNKNEKAMQYLIEQGGNVNHKNLNLNTPLNYAVCAKSLSMVRYLIEHGADVNSINKYGATALDFAQRIRCDRISNYLISKGAVVGNDVDWDLTDDSDLEYDSDSSDDDFEEGVRDSEAVDENNTLVWSPKITLTSNPIDLSSGNTLVCKS